MDSTVVRVLAIYLAVGAVAVYVFDVITHRVRMRFGEATSESQSIMANAGAFIGHRVMTIILGTIMLLFWPAVFLGVFMKEDKGSGKKE